MKSDSKIRPLALGIVSDIQGRFLFDRGFDPKKNETFYRPMGGGIEFGERGTQAVEREFFEEIGKRVEARDFIGIFENIFTFNGKEGHEIVLLYRVRFLNPGDGVFEEVPIVENGTHSSTAVWVSLEQIKRERRPIYPDGLEKFLCGENA